MSRPKQLNPPSQLTYESFQIPAHPALSIPNTSLHNLPVLIYQPFPSGGIPTPEEIESTLDLNGFQPSWRYPMYDFDHFHSTSHEVLVVIKGSQTIFFGGEGNQGGREVKVQKGDVLVLPCGVSHRARGGGGGEGFEMIGSYPKGKNWDMCYGKEGEDKATIWKRVEVLGKGDGVPDKDPIYGRDEGAPLLKEWGPRER